MKVLVTGLVAAILSTFVALLALPGTASATCSTSFSGAGYGRVFDSLTCIGANGRFDVDQDLAALGGSTFVGTGETVNNQISSVQIPSKQDGGCQVTRGYTGTNYNGAEWVINAVNNNARWLSFQFDEEINDQTSSVKRGAAC